MTNYNPFDPKPPVGFLASNPALRRHAENPIFTKDELAYPANLAFNAGVNRLNGKYYMAFRYDTFTPDGKGLIISGTGMAESDDGIHWAPYSEPVKFHYRGRLLEWANDARLSVLDGQLYLSFCYNCFHGERPGIAVWRGGVDFDVICLGVPAQRNLILAEDRVNGRFWRLERPATRRPVYDIWISFSNDLVHWGDAELLLGVEDVPFANVKIGGGPPPLRTERGYLMVFHAVDEDKAREISYPNGVKWSRRYTAGAALLDLEDPTKVIALTKSPLLVPEMAYETGNQEFFYRENVIFPCGALMDGTDQLRLYYGAGDYSTCMARIALSDLWDAMTPYTRIADMATYTPSDLMNGSFNYLREGMQA